MVRKTTILTETGDILHKEIQTYVNCDRIEVAMYNPALTVVQTDKLTAWLNL